jgi:hypothetical protein
MVMKSLWVTGGLQFVDFIEMATRSILCAQNWWESMSQTTSGHGDRLRKQGLQVHLQVNMWGREG